MDLKTKYDREVEYHEYLEKQKENYIDLSLNQPNPNNSIVELAKILFNKPARNLCDDLIEILVDESMHTVDIFCMLLELTLHGLDILTLGDHTIFDLHEPSDDVVFQIKSYLRSIGFDIKVEEDFVDDIDNTVSLYRDRTDYYCEIVNRPPKYLCPPNDWYVLNYRLIVNKKIKFINAMILDNFRAFYISKENKIFLLTFSVAK
jgi:hypothetical protein